MPGVVLGMRVVSMSLFCRRAKIWRKDIPDKKEFGLRLVRSNSLAQWRERKKAALDGGDGWREVKSENLVGATRATGRT